MKVNLTISTCTLFVLSIIVFDLNKVKTNDINGAAVSTVKKLSNCRAQLDDGQIIDLTSVDRGDNPWSDTTSTTIWNFYWNPCNKQLFYF
jgi:hypothetical protein